MAIRRGRDGLQARPKKASRLILKMKCYENKNRIFSGHTPFLLLHLQEKIVISGQFFQQLHANFLIVFYGATQP
jgi:hypothetical protein